MLLKLCQVQTGWVKQTRVFLICAYAFTYIFAYG